MPTATTDLERDWLPNLPGRVYKRSTSGGVGLDLIAEPTIDSAAMSATAIICTTDVDREGEVIVPSGVTTTKYKKNPIVLWEHGLNKNVPAPIAKCEHPDGTLALKKRKNEIEATSYFTDRNRDSEQTFALIDEGIVRATSIHVVPDYKQVRYDRGATVYEVSDLLEWSWAMLGVNPEAVRKTVERNRLAGSQISEGLLKSLKVWLPKKKAIGRGWNQSMAKSKKPKPKDDKPADGERAEKPEDDKLADESVDEGGDEAGDEPDSDSDASLPPGDESPDGPAVEGEPGETELDAEVTEPGTANEDAMKYGAQLIAGAHAASSDMLDQIQAGIGPLENPDARSAIEAFVQHEQEGLSMLEGAYAQCYPSAGEMPSKRKSVTRDDESFRKFIANGQKEQLQLSGIGAQLRVLRKSLKGEQLSILDDAIRQLTGLVSKAKSVQRVEKPAESERKPSDEAVAKAIAEMRQGFAELKREFDEIRPYAGC